MSILVNCLIIFLARILDVSIGTARTILVFRGKKLYSFIFAFVEIIIWLLVAKKVISSDTLDIYAMVAYALGFATGNVFGSLFEESMGIGYTAVEVVISKDELGLADKLREKNYAVSVIECMGANEKHYIFFMQIERKLAKGLIALIKELSPNAFITTRDTKSVYNGYFHTGK